MNNYFYDVAIFFGNNFFIETLGLILLIIGYFIISNRD